MLQIKNKGSISIYLINTIKRVPIKKVGCYQNREKFVKRTITEKELKNLKIILKVKKE